MDILLINHIKRLVIIALASDDQLMECLVLKGGNAIDIVYQSNSDKLSRASYDLDYSIEGGDFNSDELDEINQRIEQTLRQTFLENDFELFDYKFLEKPKKKNKRSADFWGGYLISFKLLQTTKFNRLGRDIEKARRNALAVKPSNSPVFEVEISKYEYVERKVEANVDGYTIYVYSAEMIAFEKIRALCQQLPQYTSIVPSHSSRARARDYYDIYLILETHQIDPSANENLQLLADIFAAKNVPVEFIKELRTHAEFHRDNWQSVVDTVTADNDLKEFDYYVDYVLNKFESLTYL